MTRLLILGIQKDVKKKLLFHPISFSKECFGMYLREMKGARLCREVCASEAFKSREF